MIKSCQQCPSTNLASNGHGGFRDRCVKCYNAWQREHWHANHEASLKRSRANYAKHAEQRRKDAKEYKAANKEYFALAEWFRRKKIPISSLKRSDVLALIAMKKAVREAKLKVGK